MRNFILLIVLVSIPFISGAQMVHESDTLYGNEWIRFDQTYHKIKVFEDGLYRISGAELQQKGVPLGSIQGSQLQLFRFGKATALYVSSQGGLSTNDYIEFYGVKNRGEFDRYLYSDPDTKQMNPEYSLYTDTSTYFLTWSTDNSGKQFTDIVNDISNAPPALEYYMHTETIVFSEDFTDLRFDQGVSLSSYEQAEGFASEALQNSGTNMPLSKIFTSGPEATFEITLATTKRITNQLEVFVGDNLVKQDTIDFIQSRTYTHAIPANELTEQMPVIVRDLNGSASRHVVAYIKATYPRQFDLADQQAGFFTLPANNDRSSVIVNVEGSNGDPVVIYDLTNTRRLVATTSNNQFQFVLPGSAEAMEVAVMIGNNENIASIDQGKNYSDWTGDNTEFIILSHPKLYDPVITGTENYVQAYVDYRKSPEGGSYDAAYYNVLDVFDLFGYGVLNHPQSIRNFTHFINKNWPDRKAFFIIGKGVQYNSSRIDVPGLEDFHFIPTFGYPGADNLLVASNWSDMPMFPIGRIAVINADEVGMYLEKIKEHAAAKKNAQTIENRAWMHQVMHLGGGVDALQQAQLENTLNSIGNILVNSSYGAEVSTYTKTSTAPVGLTKSQKILQDLERGVSIVNFYGHSSASTLDFQVNNPSEWSNQGRYPIFSAMGCSAGQVHSDFRSLSEIFTFAPSAGTVAFIAGSGSQFTSPLAAWGSSWYNSLGNKGYGKNLGETLLESYQPLNSFASSGSLTHRLLLQQQTLNGDPMIPFYTHEGPDFTTEYSSVRFNPEVVTAKQDSLEISFDILNLGKSLGDTSIRVEIIQQYPTGNKTTVYDTSVLIRRFRNPQKISFALDGSRSKGKNTFFINLDTNNEIDERPDPEAENNNELVSELGEKGIDIFIIDNRMFASHPKNFSIVNKSVVELIGTSNNAYLKDKAYVMEIDTTINFDSPLRKGERFAKFGSVVKWTPSIALIPNTVYYWRVSTDSISPEETYVWDYSSFVYLPESEPGWNQSHFYQFRQNEFTHVEMDEDTRGFQFSNRFKNIWVRNFNQQSVENRPRVFINQLLQGEFFQFWESRDVGDVFVIVVDDTTGSLLKNPVGGIHGAINPTGSQIRVFPFNTDNSDERGSLIDFLENVIPSNDYVMLYTYQRFDHQDYFPEQWSSDVAVHGKSIFDVIEAQHPASQIRELETLGSRPYVIFYQKDVGVIQESLAFLPEEALNVEYDFPNKNFVGDVYSTTIGPSKKWKNLYLDISEVLTTKDTAFVSIYGLDDAGEKTLLIQQFSSKDTTLSWISSDQYPYLQLEFHGADKPERTIPQIEHWRVTYTPFGDLILNPDIDFEFDKDTLFEGQRLSLTTGVENVGVTPMENTSMHVTITDRQNQTITSQVDIPALDPGESTTAHFEKLMLDQKGLHTIFVELNPQIKAEDQLDNNTGVLEFFVQVDELNPLLDVTFDGVHIQDGDLVSAKPLIELTLKDENDYFALDDTSSISLFIKYPFEFEYRPISLDNPEVQLYPADLGSGENEMRIEYTPTFFEDGIYELKAEAKDAAGNVSGNAAYSISFEILNERKISSFTNFPNPFRHSTRFVYTLTGDQVPDQFMIQVFNLSGQLVREITQTEIGDLRVGTHMTDYAWDGSDQYGGPLESGAYIYRVITKNADGSDYQRYNSGIGQSLRSDFGKIIIIR